MITLKSANYVCCGDTNTEEVAGFFTVTGRKHFILFICLFL